ncbi:MAG: glycoside hydrolase family 38 C-terminal domain-containing protein [Phycisphaerae bacterium]
MIANHQFHRRNLAMLLLAALIQVTATAVEPDKPATAAGKSPARVGRLYAVGYSHLDTQWRWTYPTTIDVFLRNTLEQNFARFEKYSEYVFNFTGAARYLLMKEYYPAEYERLRHYIRAGRWFVAGSSVDEGDVNVPAPESIIRQVLYGNGVFRREFGVESTDYMLPDCFGFPAALPSILAHCGLTGFSTQKLTWGSAVGIPFNLGVWVGPDGRSIVAGLNPGDYVGSIKGRVDTNAEWAERIRSNGRAYGVRTDYHYYGVGDEGGAPREEDVRNYCAAARRTDGEFRVALGSSDALFNSLTSRQREALPRYRGDLLLTEHSAGTLTSQAYMKRWNRKNECLADAAERAATLAAWLGTTTYPRALLERSWLRMLGSQMHDMLPGTARPDSISFAWNDEVIALNGFADALLTAARGVIGRLDTSSQGKAIVVYNPLAIEREDPVEATVRWDGQPPADVRVCGSSEQPVLSQILRRDGNQLTILFLARVEPVSFTVFDVRAAEEVGGAISESLNVSKRAIENIRYRLTLNEAGDVTSIRDKEAGGRELLRGPIQLVLTHERPRQWPAWNMDWADRVRDQSEAVGGPAEISVEESGPVRAAIKVTRRARDSVFTQTIRLNIGECRSRIEWATEVDWQATECALRVAFPLTVSNAQATYNLGLGTIERGNNQPRKYEVPSHEWLDLTDRDGRYGVSVIEDCKFGSDKPADNLLRLTLLYTPGVRRAYMDQHSQDWGRHEFVYGLVGHERDWRSARSEWQGRRLNQPLRAFVVAAHPGPLGRRVSLAQLSSDRVDLRAIKQAESGDAVIVRMQELIGEMAGGVALTLGRGIESAVEVDGQERRIADATVRDGKLIADLSPYSLRSFACRLKPADAAPSSNAPIALPLLFNDDVISTDADRTDGKMDAEGRTISGDLWPTAVESGGAMFALGSAAKGEKNALACRGQTLALPRGPHNRVYLLAAATEPLAATFAVGSQRQVLPVQSWTGLIGQFDCRVWERPFEVIDHHCDQKVVSLTAGFIHRAPIAWYCTHRHHPARGNESYQFCYLCRYELDRPAGADSLILPNEPRLRLFAATLVDDGSRAAEPAAPLYDDFSSRGPLTLRHVYPAPPKPVFQGATPTALVAVDRKDRFGDLKMGPPSGTDAAAQSRGVQIRVFEGDGDYPPHPRAGALGGALPRLNDGQPSLNDDDTERSVWYDNQGRFYADLLRSTRIRSINTYSWHRSNRAPQYFSLWASNDPQMPDAQISAEHHAGWTLLAVVDSRDLGGGGCHGSAVSAKSGGALGPYRHLLWVAEDVGEGTFFCEIDVHAAE